jgi:hypothetical protein
MILRHEITIRGHYATEGSADVNYKDFAGLCDVQYPRAFRYPLWRRPEELIEMQIEIFDPHTGSWKDQSKATEGRAKAVGLTA